MGARGQWGGGLPGRRARRRRGAWPRPLEHAAQPYQSDQPPLVAKERGDQGDIPSYRWSNEGILPGLSGCRMSRSLEGHDPRRVRWSALASGVKRARCATSVARSGAENAS
jgi:hypothetical protein